MNNTQRPKFIKIRKLYQNTFTNFHVMPLDICSTGYFFSSTFSSYYNIVVFTLISGILKQNIHVLYSCKYVRFRLVTMYNKKKENAITNEKKSIILINLCEQIPLICETWCRLC